MWRPTSQPSAPFETSTKCFCKLRVLLRCMCIFLFFHYSCIVWYSFFFFGRPPLLISPLHLATNPGPFNASTTLDSTNLGTNVTLFKEPEPVLSIWAKGKWKGQTWFSFVLFFYLCDCFSILIISQTYHQFHAFFLL